jgi:hypothetical protein
VDAGRESEFPRGRPTLSLGVVALLALAVWGSALWTLPRGPRSPTDTAHPASGRERTPWERVAERFGDHRTDDQIRDANQLYLAVLSGDEAAARHALAAGADPSARYLDPCGPGPTPLLEASGRGDERLVALLLAHGADPNLGHDGESPLAAANRAGHARVARRLETAGARGVNP